MTASFKNLLHAVAGLLNTHLSMLQLDLQETKEKIVHLGLLAAGFLICSGVLLSILTLGIGVFCWYYSPLYTVIGLTAFYLFWVLFFVCRLRAFLKGFTPFSLTISELKKNKEVFLDER